MPFTVGGVMAAETFAAEGDGTALRAAVKDVAAFPDHHGLSIQGVGEALRRGPPAWILLKVKRLRKDDAKYHLPFGLSADN